MVVESIDEKGCILVLMALMCLFVFEEGDLVGLGSFRGLPLQPCSSEIPSDKSGKVKSFRSKELACHNMIVRHVH